MGILKPSKALELDLARASLSQQEKGEQGEGACQFEPGSLAVVRGLEYHRPQQHRRHPRP